MTASDDEPDPGFHEEPSLTRARTAAPRQPDPSSPPGPLDIESLRYPTEASRFALLLFSSAVAVSIGLCVLIVAGRSVEILGGLIIAALTLGMLRLALLLWRLRLLAEGVRVDAESLPAVQDVIDAVRARLDYYGRVDVFVVDKASRILAPDAAPVTLTSFFGFRVVVIEGGAIGELAEPTDKAQLIFLLATYFGAIKARHSRWSPLLVALGVTGLPSILFLFFQPWYRATVYTGDRIGYSCCADLRVSVVSVYEQLVGKEVAPQLRTSGLVQQALEVRRSMPLRLAQLLRPVPHTTNRYLQLLAFVAGREPATFEDYVGVLPNRSSLDSVLTRLRRRHPSRVAVPAACAISLSLICGGVSGGAWARAYVDRTVDGMSPAAEPTPHRVQDQSGVRAGRVAPPVQPAKYRDLSASVTSVTAPRIARDGVDGAGRPASYRAANTMDADPTTCWRVRGDGSGLELTVVLDAPRTITTVGLINGYAKRDTASLANRYLQERRITSVTWIFGTGQYVKQSLRASDPDPQGLSLSAPVTTGVVKIRLDSTTPPGNPAFDYTAISEIYLVGQ